MNAMAAAGWYPDPYDPTQLRYWDGSEWTEHTHEIVLEPVEAQQPAPDPADTPEPASAPPFIPNPGDQSPGLAAADGNQGPGDIGQWLGRTFRVGLSKLPACLGLALVGFLPSVFVYLTAGIALRNLDGGGGIGSPDTAAVLFFAAFLAFVGWMLWLAVTVLAQNHLLHEAHLGRPTSMGSSLQAGLAGLGRLIWAYLVLLAYAVTLWVVFVLLVAAGAFVENPAVIGLLLMIYLGLIAVAIWVQVKTAFIAVAAAVAPDGRRPFPISVELSNGRFWAVFGRMLLLGLVLALLFIPMAIVMSVITALVGRGLLAPDDAASTGSVVAMSVIFGLLFPMLGVGYQVISFSGIVRLYIDLGGPSRPAQARDDDPVPSVG